MHFQRSKAIIVVTSLVSGCASHPDASTYEEGKDKIAFGYITASSDGKRIAHYGRGSSDLVDADGIPAALAAAPGIVKVISASSETLFYWRHPALSPQCVAFSPTGSHIVVGNASAKISATEPTPGAFFVIDLNSKKKVFETASAQNYRSASFSSDGRLLAVSFYDSDRTDYVRLFEFPAMKEAGRSDGASAKLIKGLVFCDSDAKIAVSCFEGTIEFLETPSMKKVGSVAIDEKLMGNIRQARDQIVVQGENKKLHVLDAKKMEIAFSLESHSGGVARFDLVPQTSLLLSCGTDQDKTEKTIYDTFKLWDLTKKVVLREWKQPIVPFALLPDRTVALVEDSQIRIRELDAVLPSINRFLPK